MPGPALPRTCATVTEQAAPVRVWGSREAWGRPGYSPPEWHGSEWHGQALGAPRGTGA